MADKKKKQPFPRNVISPARKAAFSILLKLERGAAASHSHAHSDDLLHTRAVSVLSAADRNLTTALVLGVLRGQLTLDAKIRPLLARPNAKLDAEILLALRLGAYQLLHLDRIPAHAAIAESVELARQAGHKFASGMVNAVLRKLSAAQAERASDPSSAVQAHPEWLVERWTRFYGQLATEEICLHGQQQPVLTVRLTDPDVAPALSGITLIPGEMLTAARHVTAGDVTAEEAFRTGRIRIQDEGSQLVAEIAAMGLKNARAETILDCCAAPGGKTLILAERNPTAHIVACDSNAQRLEQLRQRIAECHPNIRERIDCRIADASVAEAEAMYDIVLADVPCSGTGTLGRNPEIRYRLTAEDFNRQAERQQGILRNALHAVRPGGCVIYSTCSLEPEENEQVVSAVVKDLAGKDEISIRQISLAPVIQALVSAGRVIPAAGERLNTFLTPQGNLILLPGRFSTDGFFISVIERIL